MTLNSFWVKQHLNVTKVKKKKKTNLMYRRSIEMEQLKEGVAEMEVDDGQE